MSKTANKSSTMAVAGCVAMIGIGWALATICVFINIRNGVRLTTDNYGSVLNGALVAGVSIAPIAATSFTGYHFRGGRWGKAITCLLVAVPLIIFNAWSSTEFVGDQMLGQIKAQEDNLSTKKQLSESINAEKLRSKREAEERFLDAWVRTKDPAEKARIEKQLEKLRAETPELTAPMADPKAGARASWLSKRLGWDRETIEGITPTVLPILVQIVEVFFSLMGFASWPGKSAAETSGNQQRLPATVRQLSRTEAEKARKTAQADLEQLVAQNAEPCVTECAARWGVDKGTASKWISDFVRNAPMRKIQRGKRKIVVAHPRLKIVESS
jgi:hypothetical protein